MKQEDFILSINDPQNARSKKVTITAKGLQALNAIDKCDDGMFLPANYLSEETAKKINENLFETLRMIE